MRKQLAFACVAVIGLTGCALPPEPGAAPQSIDDCRAQYEAARQRGAYTPPPRTRGEFIGAAIGKGIAAGMLESRYKRCVESLGGTPSGIIPANPPLQSTANPRPQPPAPKTQGCVLEMVGGDGYACR